MPELVCCDGCKKPFDQVGRYNTELCLACWLVATKTPIQPKPDFAQGQLIYRSQLIDALEDIYALRWGDDDSAIETELGQFIEKLKADPGLLSTEVV